MLTCVGKFQPAPFNVSVASYATFEIPIWMASLWIVEDTPVNLMLILNDVGDTPTVITERLCGSVLWKFFVFV